MLRASECSLSAAAPLSRGLASLKAGREGAQGAQGHACTRQAEGKGMALPGAPAACLYFGPRTAEPGAWGGCPGLS